MDFDLSKPQKLLKQSARELLARECPPARVRRALEAHDEELWQTIVEQGWTDLLSIGLVELAVVMEEAGRVCMPGPFLPTIFAGAVLQGIGATEELGERKATVAIADEQGVAHFVMEAHVADVIVMVSGRPARQPSGVPPGGNDTVRIIAARDVPPAARIRRTPSMDETRKLCTMSFDGEAPALRGDVSEAVDIATIALCAEMVGGMQWVLDTTVDYAKTRQQFGKPIGSFQAVQHQCADMLLLTESARSATYYAAYERSPLAVSIAKAYCSDAYREVCNKGIQVHGGIGFTWEHDLQFFLKRGKTGAHLYGTAREHRERVAELTGLGTS
ncbi:MAG TPA: acyl-CoA dehydrogenase family protein [Thermoanaerobaculia bacterium]|nr:acyl-CoA dehydrogenase family protein [Thermoanaerobaculia bacterium]